MKMKMGRMGVMGAVIVGAIALVAGCALFGADPTPPSKFEQTHYDILTNIVTVEVVRTNQVTVTNVEILTVTNTQNQLISFTNFVPQVIQLFNTNTVQKETYEYHPNTNAAALTAGAAKLGELSGVPGVGSLISIAGGLLWGAWGTLRSSGRGKALAVASQSLATAQQVLVKTPQGQRLSQEMQTWLDQHHEVAGAATILDQFTDKYVDDGNARDAAHRIFTLAQGTPAPAT